MDATKKVHRCKRKLWRFSRPFRPIIILYIANVSKIGICILAILGHVRIITEFVIWCTCYYVQRSSFCYRQTIDNALFSNFQSPICLFRALLFLLFQIDICVLYDVFDRPGWSGWPVADSLRVLANNKLTLV